MDGGLARIGRLLPGFHELSEGVNSPVRGIAATDAGEVTVIAKKVSLRVLGVELACAVYGRAAGLPIPEPLVLLDDAGALHFGSVDISHPSLAQFISLSDTSAHSHLVDWPGLLSAACFDELIVNPDRHEGNLLYDGQSFTLIDHDLCMPHGMVPTSAFTPDDANVLLKLAIDALPKDDLSKRRMLKDANSWIASLEDHMVDSAEAAMDGVCTSAIQSQLTSFLRLRLAKLSDLITDKVNPEQGRLSLANDKS
ncbi:hypothetical protein AB1A96_03380 [Pseudomonas juntendi]